MSHNVGFDAFEELLLNYNPEVDQEEYNTEGFSVIQMSDDEMLEFINALTLMQEQKEKGEGE